MNSVKVGSAIAVTNLNKNRIRHEHLTSDTSFELMAERMFASDHSDVMWCWCRTVWGNRAQWMGGLNRR